MASNAANPEAEMHVARLERISTKRGKYVVNVRSGTVSTGLDIMSQDIMWPTMTNFQGSVLVFPAIGYNNWLQ